MHETHGFDARGAASPAEKERVREALQRDLNDVLLGFLPSGDRVGNDIVRGETLVDALERFESAVSVSVEGPRSSISLKLLYDSSEPSPIPARRRNRRAPSMDEFICELANQFVGAICQRLPDARSRGRTSPPYVGRIHGQASSLAIGEANAAQHQSDRLSLGWACHGTTVAFSTFCLLTVREHGKTQKQIARALENNAVEDEIDWLGWGAGRGLAV